MSKKKEKGTMFKEFKKSMMVMTHWIENINKRIAIILKKNQVESL